MKFNTTNTNKTVNRSGHAAYSMTKKEHLVTAALTTMFGEPKYYGSTDQEIIQLATECAQADPDFLCRLVCYARNEGNMRSVSHVLACVIAHEAHTYTRKVLGKIIIRPDDITEIMSCYLQLYGKPYPNAMKREVAVQLQKFNEYQLAKYNGGSKSMKLRDVLRITHPHPADKNVEELFGKILKDTLETPYTWETELSEKGNTKKVWDALIASGKLGYMAMLRNLRNIVVSGANVQPVLNTICDPEQVRKSRQLPFRYYSAYKALDDAELMTGKIREALEKALEVSAENIDMLPGRTLIAVDSSGSMFSPVSKRSDVTCYDIANLLGVMSTRICEDATVCYFNYAGSLWDGSTRTGYRICNFGKYDSVLDGVSKNDNFGGGTDLSLPIKWALDTDTGLRPFDRIIYFSDSECNSGLHEGQTAHSFVEKYRRERNPKLWVHGIDLQGYGTQQFTGKNTNLIAGWGEYVLTFIGLAENGISTLVDTIANYPID